MSENSSPLALLQELTNDKVHVSVHHRPACRVELTVKTARSLIDAARKEAIKSINKEVLFPGFRKGKAPEQMVLRKFPKDVEKELHKSLADLAFKEAQNLAKVPVLNRSSQVTFDLKNISDETAELFFRFETEPTVPSIDPKLFQPKPTNRKEITDVEVDEAIHQVRFFFADWKTVIDRPIQVGDYILIDVDTVEEEMSQKVFRQIRFEVSPKRMAEWMQKLVVGAKVNDVLEGLSEPDANATEAEKQEFLPKKVRITIYKVEEAALPEIDDALAQKMRTSNVEEMRGSISQMLNAQADEKSREDLQGQVTDFLIRTYPVEIPESLITAERDHRHKEMLKNPKFRKEWENKTEEEKKTATEKMVADCRNSVALFYLSRQVVNDAQIPITHQQVEQEAIATLRSQSQEPVEVSQIPREVFALAFSKVILAKAQDYIIEAQK